MAPSTHVCDNIIEDPLCVFISSHRWGTKRVPKVNLVLLELRFGWRQIPHIEGSERQLVFRSRLDHRCIRRNETLDIRVVHEVPEKVALPNPWVCSLRHLCAINVSQTRSSSLTLILPR